FIPQKLTTQNNQILNINTPLPFSQKTQTITLKQHNNNTTILIILTKKQLFITKLNHKQIK
ncbi:hypothetical protein DF186_14450, partial [Enterococcus hirae]